jgi:hypothetical protein
VLPLVWERKVNDFKTMPSMWKGKPRIPVNIWDDYDEDEGGETHAYIEESNWSDETKAVLMKVVYDFVSTLDLDGAKIDYDEGSSEIGFNHLNHDRRERLVEELNAANLQYDGVAFDFYSES